MIADAFIRQARVAIAPPGIVLTQELRIGFDLQLDAQRDPPPSVLTLTNLAEATTARLVKPASVEIQVGYRGHPLAEIYAGDVARIEHKMEGRDRVTRIRLGPRDRGTRTATILASSYQGTVPLRTIVQDIGERLGIPLGSLDALPNVHVPDFASFDKAEDALTDLLRPRGVEWYEAGGALQFRRRGQTTGTVGFVLSERTGMIDRPERTDKGMRARMRLNPRLRLGGHVRVDSQRLVGVFQVFRIRHVGDTWDGEWASAVEGVTV